uniref:Uncharacterized protein n=1 Tax=Arundo donax TaxID=35708 RepID=A0A0A9B176_ARUDO
MVVANVIRTDKMISVPRRGQDGEERNAAVAVESHGTEIQAAATRCFMPFVAVSAHTVPLLTLGTHGCSTEPHSKQKHAPAYTTSHHPHPTRLSPPTTARPISVQIKMQRRPATAPARTAATATRDNPRTQRRRPCVALPLHTPHARRAFP